MIRIGITQRVVFVDRIQERRDVLDQRWQHVAKALGYQFIPIPNRLDSPAEFADSLNFNGIIFSGGNNVGIQGRQQIQGKTLPDDDVAYERDQTERALMDWAIKQKKPLLGVCRGLQFINAYLGGELIPVSPENHVANDHTVRITDDAWKKFYGDQLTVNSYHNWGISLTSLADSLRAVALFEESEVEAFKHTTYSIYGIMWHPEREEKLKTIDRCIFESIFKTRKV